VAEKSSWDQTNIGLIWRNRKKISQIIKDYFNIPFFLLIILWLNLTEQNKIFVFFENLDDLQCRNGELAADWPGSLQCV
jgi:hypothetical protein